MRKDIKETKNQTKNRIEEESLIKLGLDFDSIFEDEDTQDDSFMVVYNDMKSNPNNFSNWFPKIEHCGINVPKSKIIQVPIDVVKSFALEKEDDIEIIINWTKEYVMPIIRKLHGFAFIKNACYSNKFNASTCLVYPKDNVYSIANKISEINYNGLMNGAGGCTELIVREMLEPLPHEYTIYNGLPLRTEFRVFYDFDKHKVCYTSNYWDASYCMNGMYDANDKLIFSTYAPIIADRFNRHIGEVESLVDKHMKNISNLTGKWSIDIMMHENKYWLIDMAKANESAYFDERRVE